MLIKVAPVLMFSSYSVISRVYNLHIVLEHKKSLGYVLSDSVKFQILLRKNHSKSLQV